MNRSCKQEVGSKKARLSKAPISYNEKKRKRDKYTVHRSLYSQLACKAKSKAMSKHKPFKSKMQSNCSETARAASPAHTATEHGKRLSD